MEMNKGTQNKKENEIKTARFLDGKKQIIELLRHLPIDEKNKLIKNLRIKNPEVANGLIEDGISYGQIETLSDDHLKILIQYISPQIFGLAMKYSSKKLVEKILTMAPRNYSELAYEILISFVDESPKKSKIAQEKIINTAIKLFGKNRFLQV